MSFFLQAVEVRLIEFPGSGDQVTSFNDYRCPYWVTNIQHHVGSIPWCFRKLFKWHPDFLGHVCNEHSACPIILLSGVCPRKQFLFLLFLGAYLLIKSTGSVFAASLLVYPNCPVFSKAGVPCLWSLNTPETDSYRNSWLEAKATILRSIFSHPSTNSLKTYTEMIKIIEKQRLVFLLPCGP